MNTQNLTVVMNLLKSFSDYQCDEPAEELQRYQRLQIEKVYQYLQLMAGDMKLTALVEVWVMAIALGGHRCARRFGKNFTTRPVFCGFYEAEAVESELGR